MHPSQTPPDLSALEPDRIRDLPFPELAAAACAALDTLRDGSGGVEGALELLETAEADALYEALWQVHLIPHIRRVPAPNPYEAQIAQPDHLGITALLQHREAIPLKRDLMALGPEELRRGRGATGRQPERQGQRRGADEDNQGSTMTHETSGQGVRMPQPWLRLG